MDVALGHYLGGPPNIQTDITERALQLYNFTLFTGISKYAALYY